MTALARASFSRAAASCWAMQQRLYFLPLPQGQRSFRPILAIPPTSVQRTDPLYQAVLADAKFHAQLLVFDRDLSATARAAGCGRCGGVLHSALFGRKPRGGPAGLGRDYARRFSFCCAVDGCRKRLTPLLCIALSFAAPEAIRMASA